MNADVSHDTCSMAICVSNCICFCLHGSPVHMEVVPLHCSQFCVVIVGHVCANAALDSWLHCGATDDPHMG